MTKLETLEQGLAIDQNALDEALLTHTDFYYRVSKELTLLISQRDAAKQFHTEEEARAEAKVRHDAEVREEKVTNPQVASIVALDPKVRKAREDWLRLNKEVGLYSALQESFQQRSYALSKLCDLYVAGYFGDVPGKAANGVKNRAGRDAREAISRERVRRSAG